MRGALLIALVIGCLDAARSSAAASPCCCPHGCSEGFGSCEWLAAAGCCESSPLASGPNVTPMPAVAAVLRSTPRASATAHRTPGQASATPERVGCVSLVLRL
jgi:hypothetical protein